VLFCRDFAVILPISLSSQAAIEKSEMFPFYIYTVSSNADFVYLTFPELSYSMAFIFSEIVTSEYFLRTAMHERGSVEEFSVDTAARHVKCYIFPLHLLNQYFPQQVLCTAFVVVVQGALPYVVAAMDELV